MAWVGSWKRRRNARKQEEKRQAGAIERRQDHPHNLSLVAWFDGLCSLDRRELDSYGDEISADAPPETVVEPVYAAVILSSEDV